MAVVVYFQFGGQFGTRHAFPAGGQCFDDGFVLFRSVEDGFVQTVEFTGELCIFSEEECVNVLREAFVPFKQIQVERYTTENHIGLEDADVGPGESSFVEVIPGFSERKGEKVFLVGDAVVEAAFVVDDVAYDPGRGAPADNQEDFLVFTRPIVPEAINGFDETAFGRSQARQFVNENDHTLSRD